MLIKNTPFYDLFFVQKDAVEQTTDSGYNKIEETLHA